MLFAYVISGLIGVSIMVLWGIYGDLLIEDFKTGKVLRSLVLGILGSVFIYWTNPNLPLFVVALNVITFERIITEIYKALIRDERQAKYLIPSDLNINLPRNIEKFSGFVLIFLILISYRYINFSNFTIGVFLIAALVPAIGGALKDAPYEGFYPFKFLRSPLVILLVGLVVLKLYPMTGGKYLLFSLWGGERILSEFYKKIFRGYIPGKFRRDIHHHINHNWRLNRRYVLIPYLYILADLLFLIIIDNITRIF